MSEDSPEYGKVVQFGSGKKKEWWFRVGRSLIERRDILPELKYLMICLMGYRSPNGNCNPTVDQLRRATGLSEKTLSNRCKKLKDQGHLDWKYYRDENGLIRRQFTLFPQVDKSQEIPPKINEAYP